MAIEEKHIRQAVRNLHRREAFRYFSRFYWIFGAAVLWVFALGWTLGYLLPRQAPLGVYFVTFIYTVTAIVMTALNRKKEE